MADRQRRPLPAAVARQNATRAAAAVARAEALRPQLERLHQQGLGPQQIAAQLTADGVEGPSGGPLPAHYVRRCLQRLGLAQRGPSHGPRHGAAVAAGMRQARLRGGGDPGNSPGAVAARARRSAAAQARAEALRDVVLPLYREGLTLAAIAAALNAQGISSTGHPMTVCSVRALLQRLGLPTGRGRLGLFLNVVQVVEEHHIPASCNPDRHPAGGGPPALGQ